MHAGQRFLHGAIFIERWLTAECRSRKGRAEENGHQPVHVTIIRRDLRLSNG
jgi:hypothetical protein